MLVSEVNRNHYRMCLIFEHANMPDFDGYTIILLSFVMNVRIKQIHFEKAVCLLHEKFKESAHVVE